MPSPKSPGLEDGSGDIWSETRWRQSPDLRLQGISWGSRRAAPFPCAAPRGSKSQKSSWWKGKGTAGPCGFTPCLVSGQQSRGKTSRAPLPADELPNPRKSIQTPEHCPPNCCCTWILARPRLSGQQCPRLGSLLGSHCCLPPTLSKYPSSAPQSFMSQHHQSDFLIILGWWQQAGDHPAVPQDCLAQCSCCTRRWGQ